MGQAKKNRDYEDYLKNAKPFDSFEFGVVPNYKKFPQTFNIDNLKNYEHVRKQGSCPNPLYQKHDVN